MIRTIDTYNDEVEKWITIQHYKNFRYGINETYTDSVDFVNYKISLPKYIDSDDD